MEAELRVTGETIELTDGGKHAAIDRDAVRFAHLGCRNLVGAGWLPEELADGVHERYAERAEPRGTSAAARVAKGLEAAVTASGTRGCVLIDTMRKGSQAWRPGQNIRLVAEKLAGRAVVYAWRPEWCPSLKLLVRFTKTSMPYGEFAQEYAGELNGGGALAEAAAAVVDALATRLLPVFFCVDPYIPGYGKHEEFLSEVAYRDRTWADEPRTAGCHRFVLAEELVRRFLAMGAPVDLYGVDPTLSDAYHDRYSPDPGQV